ncbi:MAG: hypothetical protein QF570_08075 [Myxococcota bacterium]|jgi:hypothetical protein|nr:hypothetical protein [Myxococcota bacterium]
MIESTLRTLATTLTLMAGCAMPTAEPADPLAGANLFGRVTQYADLGDHRTGGRADSETTAWLASELERWGYAVELQPFDVKQFFPAEQSLDANGLRLEVFPHWLPKPADSLKAPLVPLRETDLEGKIAYLSPEEAGEWYRVRPSDLAVTAASKGALALVVALPHPSGEIYVTNAAHPFLDAALPIPTVVVAARNDEKLQPLLGSEEVVELESKGEMREVTAHNVLARYPAREIPGAPWTVISTPTSGWFRCAGERGSGVALWLGLAEWIAQGNHGQKNWLFVANSGHELSFAGAHVSLPAVPPSEDVALWLHLGASIAARAWQETAEGLEPMNRVHDYNQLFYRDNLSSLVDATFARIPQLQTLPYQQMRPGRSELNEILRAGYRAMGFVGPHRFFHTPLDLPSVTSPELLEPYGEALRRLVREVAAD